MRCDACQSPLLRDWAIARHETVELWCVAWRCTTCNAVVDQTGDPIGEVDRRPPWLTGTA